jgi:C1A family cysteine protease
MTTSRSSIKGQNKTPLTNEDFLTDDEPSNLHFGWVRDLPDHRDFSVGMDNIPFTPSTAKVSPQELNDLLAKVNHAMEATTALPTSVDLRPYCSPIENQGNLGSCTAQAGVGMLEYFERRAFGHHIEGSRLFLYKVCRKLAGFTGDFGCYLRSTMAGMALFGVALEKYYPYNIANFDAEPDAFTYALAQNYQAITYYRLDPPGTDPNVLLDRIKRHLSAQLPCMFGFTVYDSRNQAVSNGSIPYPSINDRVVGGHAVVAVGYDDNKEIVNLRDGRKTKGALIIRNSWGAQWGANGYGYLPYEYVLKGLSADFWCLIKNEYVITGHFGI